MDGAMSFEETMTHFGVKGMHWGSRKNRMATSGPPSHDATKAAEAKAKIGKKGNTSVLSNQELQALVTRMNLERQFSTLSSQNKKENPGAKFAKELLISVGKQQAQKFAGDLVAKQIASQLAKQVAKKAAASV